MLLFQALLLYLKEMKPRSVGDVWKIMENACNNMCVLQFGVFHSILLLRILLISVHQDVFQLCMSASSFNGLLL